ncbi:uncharacterized protein LOC111617874 [Centruroides sculpturatus]|uniref:uncharacterized protein LOC111617874 n=1 Tax=Centruroides sculpturatus TaxID=218467 RepID=UPI000C6E0EF5|nr:uncharacterized protein LOC111617874 [Centruroides sculpturatus]
MLQTGEMNSVVFVIFLLISKSVEGKAAPMKGIMNYEAYHLLNLSEIFNKSSSVSEGACLDHRGKIVDRGERYFPLGSDPCTQCTCVNGKPEMCISVFCSPPENCRQYHALSDKCCEFVCLDRDHSDKTYGGNGNITRKEDTETINATNLGLRLVASTVTSFLILALLLFMIHRLHQRRLLLMIRRFHARRVDNGPNGSQRYPLDDEGSVGYLVGGDHVDFSQCSEPPPPYAFWKPSGTYIPPGEAPPPYEASVGTVLPNYNGAVIRNSNENENVENDQQRPQPQQIPSLILSTTILPNTYLNSNTSDTSNCQQAERHGRLASISSVSMISDNDINTLRSDAHYEDAPVYMPNNVTILRIGQGGSIVSTALCEEDLANGNILPNECISPNECGNFSTNKNNNSSINKKAKHNCRYKHHSCSEILDQPQNSLSRREDNNKRCSLQTSNTNKSINKAYPDPTWMGEGSETSSSSSPTYEQCTFSPSSSDSSSMEVDFCLDSNTLHIKQIEDQTAKPCVTNNSSFQDGLPCDNVSTPVTSGRRKSTSFDKTLQHLRKFSLGHQKKKKKSKFERDLPANESNIENNSKSKNYSVSYQSGATNNPAFQECDRVHKTEVSNQKVFDSSDGVFQRPASLCLVVRNSSELTDERPQLKSVSLESQDGCTPIPATVVAVHCSAAAKVNRLGTGCPHSISISPDSNSDGLQAYISEQYALHATSPYQESSPSNSKSGISRSGSICSETGERRHHSNNSPNNFECLHFISRHGKSPNLNKNVNLSDSSNFSKGALHCEDNASLHLSDCRLYSRTNGSSEDDRRHKMGTGTESRSRNSNKDSEKSQQFSTDNPNQELECIFPKTSNDKFKLLTSLSKPDVADDSCSSHL